MKILYFAWLREQVGRSEETLEPPTEIVTVGDLIDWLKARGPRHAEAFSDNKMVRCAVDQEFAALSTPLAGAGEVAFFPPVTGG